MTNLATLLVSVLLLWPLLAQGATYTVNGSTGTDGSCGGTLRTVRYTIETCARTPNDIIDIRAGTYPEIWHHYGNDGPPSTNWVTGNTLATPITIRGHAGETVIINGTCTKDHCDMVDLEPGEEGYSFENLTFDGINMVSFYGGSIMRLADGNRVQDSTFKNYIPNRGGPITDPTNQHTNSVLGGFRNQILRNTLSDSKYCIYVTYGNNVIDGNYCHDSGGYGIHRFDGCDPANPPPEGCHFDLNVNNVIRNNLLVRNGLIDGTPQTGGCMVIGIADNTQVYNNVCLDSPTRQGIQVYSRTTNTKIYNNTIVGNNGPCIWIEGGSSTTGTDVRGNICYNNSQEIRDEGAGTIKANNNPNANNPRFVNPPDGNYRLQTSPTPSDALNAAPNLSSVFTGDITGTVTRPATGPWDQGAYEMEAGGSGSLIPEKGTFFIDDTGTNTTDCHAATGAVGSPSATPFGDYATARVCMLPGSTLYFRTGTYPPLDSMSTPFTGGSPSDGPTTLAAYPGETVTLQATTLNPVVVFLHNSLTDHFIILQGLILDGLNIVGTNGFAAYPGVNDIRLDGVEIRNTYYEGVFLQQTSNVELRNATKVHNSAFASVGVVGLDRTTNTTITGSEVYASGGPGISSYGGNSNLIIEKSTIRNTPSGKGIILGNASTPDSGVRIANNLIYTNTHGIHLQNGTTGVGLYYNTLWNNSTACMLFDSGVTVSEAINNVCWQVANVTNNAGPTNMVLTTNQCTGPTGCTAGDPLFASVTPGDVNFLHLCGAAGVPVVGCTGKSPAIDTGTPIPSLTSDFASKARPDGVQVDKGAFEEVPVSVPPAQVGLAPVYRTTHFLTLLP